jgi:fructuronate reductase
VAAWMRYVGGVDEAGAPIEVKDPLAQRLRRLSDGAGTPEEKVAALLGVTEVFPADLAILLRRPVTAAYERLLAAGARGAAAEVVA